MRGLLLPLMLGLTGCATSVQRLDGEIRVPTGDAVTPCEQADWLVVAPTRTEWAERGRKTTDTRDDALGLYRVGASFPESIPGLADELPASPMVERHQSAASSYDNQRIAAAALGAAGVAAIAIGTIVFINAFETTSTRNSAGVMEDKQTVAGGRAALGGVLVGVGFGIGIGGILVSPRQSERARGDSARYTFLPPDDTREEVVHLADEHNRRVRERCAKPGGPAGD
ncbi:MAG: hypothetical protein OZ921_09755 [Sorangiineae bacterium]|nr:hypothetical protein [Polyangiaceae bacterium]MEB2322788.1 hypothetical protein [Sorangiineae bacterium]